MNNIPDKTISGMVRAEYLEVEPKFNAELIKFAGE